MFLPTYLARRSYNEEIEDRLSNMWRTHKNRVDRGLGPTYHEYGRHESMKHGMEFIIPNFHWSAQHFVDGDTDETYLYNVFNRWHESFEKYSSHLADMDDVQLYQTEDFDRFNKFKAKDKHVVGTTRAIPLEDNDEKFEFYDI